MAGALRCLARTAKFTAFRRVTEALAAPSTFTAAKFQIQSRNVNTFISPNVNELDTSKLPDYETSSEEWHYVERLIPPKIVPLPKHYDGKSPAGWVPPREEALNHPYFVPRNKNHMMPVYFKLKHRGSRQLTLIRNIDGDIWQLEKDIREFLKPMLPELEYARLSCRVNEMSRQIQFRGDYVNYIKKFMEIKGF